MRQSAAVQSVMSVSQSWEDDAPGSSIRFAGSVLTRTSSSAGRNPHLVVRVDKVIPGNAIAQPGLIGQMQNELQQGLSQDYAQEFLAAMRKEVGAKRNESAIQAMKTRMMSSGG